MDKVEREEYSFIDSFLYNNQINTGKQKKIEYNILYIRCYFN